MWFMGQHLSVMKVSGVFDFKKVQMRQPQDLD